MALLGGVDPIASSDEEGFLIKEILLTHISDDFELDSESLLHVVERIFCSVAEVFDAVGDECSDVDRPEDPISVIIYKISSEQMCFQCFVDENAHKKAMALLEMLGRYRWDGKVTIALAALMHIIGSVLLILQQRSNDTLASTLAKIKQPCGAISDKLKLRSKALNLLLKTMLKVSKSIVRFERGVACSEQDLVDDDVVKFAKPKIYLATYWIFRGVSACALQMMIADVKSSKPECMFFSLNQYSDKGVIAALRLHDIGNNLTSSCRGLEEMIDTCHQQIGTRLYAKLRTLFSEKQSDNQRALMALFSSQGKLPLMNPSSREKFGISELKNKVVLLLITKPELMLPMHRIFPLLQQTCNDTNGNNPQEHKSYTILWVPIKTSLQWNPDEKKLFTFLSNYMPWPSVRKPWSLNLTVVKYITNEWKFREDPIMIALDEQGTLTNSNAMDMVWIWGTKACPFSASRERQLWRERREDPKIDLLFDGVCPFLQERVIQGKNVCIYGSNDLDWVIEFNRKLRKIELAGIEVGPIYVGCKNPNKDELKPIIDAIEQENISISLDYTKIDFFWARLESMKKIMIECQGHDENPGNAVAG